MDDDQQQTELIEECNVLVSSLFFSEIVLLFFFSF